jgi:hypothetical protein
VAEVKVRWLDRRIAAPAPYLALCLADSEFRSALAQIDAKYTPKHWVTPGADATTHYYRNSGGGPVCIVCVSGHEGRDPVEVAGLLVHEAVHVWQEYAESIGETRPGCEQEAYAIQSIAQELMAEFARRMSE